ncbi:hypothetical protein VNO77_22579 [Canavalia gladiata]|uniref:Uncharacterized protein n=1 Tax=Canavalia gladiata TaxID=3824 RepID=A0AAN9QAX4_CANGL
MLANNKASDIADRNKKMKKTTRNKKGNCERLCYTCVWQVHETKGAFIMSQLIGGELVLLSVEEGEDMETSVKDYKIGEYVQNYRKGRSLIGGDFNSIKVEEKRISTSIVKRKEDMIAFETFMRETEVLDLPL